MNPTTVIILVLALLLLLLLTLFLTSLRDPEKKSGKNGILLISIIVLLVILFILLFVNTYTPNENFHFTVSPQRTKCLLEQVLPIPRTDECCGKGTVGGYPPKYQEWTEEPTAMKRTEVAPKDAPVPDYVPHETCGGAEGYTYDTEGKTGFVYYFRSAGEEDENNERKEGFSLRAKSRADILEAVRRGA